MVASCSSCEATRCFTEPKAVIAICCSVSSRRWLELLGQGVGHRRVAASGLLQPTHVDPQDRAGRERLGPHVQRAADDERRPQDVRRPAVPDRDLPTVTGDQEESEQAGDDQERPGRLALPVDRRVRRDVHPQLALDETIDQIAWQASEEALLQRGFDVRFHPPRTMARFGRDWPGQESTFTLAAVLTSVSVFISPAAVSSIATLVAVFGRSLGWIDGRGG